MSEKLRQLFKNASETNPPEKLEGLILAQIEKIQQRKLWTRLAFSFFGAFASASTAIYIFTAFGESIIHSEFWSLLSLAFSDAAIVAIHWQEFILSLLETLPIATFTLFLTPIFTLLLSLNFIFKNQNQFNKFNY